MFGSPDDRSCVSHSSETSMPTISDSDFVRDAKQIHWQSRPDLKDAAAGASLPPHSFDSLIQPDAGSSNSGKGVGNVKAKMKAVARFLTFTSKHRPPSSEPSVDAVAPVGETKVPIAEPCLPRSIVTPTREDRKNQQRATRNDNSKPTAGDRPQYGASNPATKDGFQTMAEGTKAKPVIESLPERLDSQHDLMSRPPPPPPLDAGAIKSDAGSVKTFSTPVPPMTAMLAKKRYPRVPETPLLFPPREQQPVRIATPHPIRPAAVRVASRPLPPTPALAALSADRLQKPLMGLGLSVDPQNASQLEKLIDAMPHLRRFPYLRRGKDALDANHLASELESLVSFHSERRSVRQATSIASSITAAEIADSSREAVCHWRPDPESPHPAVHFNTRESIKAANPTASSLCVEESSEETESVRRIQHWRVQITQAPSVLSKVASAHSRFLGTDDVSSHLTSVSRSPLSKESGEQDAEITPTMKARRVVGRDVAKLLEPKTSPRSVKSNGKAHHHQQPNPDQGQLGTQHIARLSDSQFDRLARASEGTLPSSRSAPVPRELPLDNSHLQPSAPPNTPARQSNSVDDDRRTSLEAPPTTVSVLEQKATQHLNTLDLMIRSHPEKMVKIFKERPGLMLVVLLRCKVEDRIDNPYGKVEKVVAPLVDVGISETKKDVPKKTAEEVCLGLIEESLLDLRFDSHTTANGGPRVTLDGLSTSQQQAEVTSTPSIVISQHTGRLTPTPSAPSPSKDISSTPNPTSFSHDSVNVNADIMLAELDSRSNAALGSVVDRLQRTGELCAVQQSLVALEQKMMNTNNSCSRLGERLSVVRFADVKKSRGDWIGTDFLLFDLIWRHTARTDGAFAHQHPEHHSFLLQRVDVKHTGLHNDDLGRNQTRISIQDR
ncbi:ubiquinone/menaquinone biosynthesis methyltransferase [Pseudozyma hubeiensis SY62]|uniref:Ubiquinone/menaquinone biosynthesis methyltransferase n=1 Tax=Pseudozyma hubeiensis (strain SY62) TaxID=1305764 RepID=R9P6W5_PSEHS|nr:ubiquinone/menaquinone biosynthesis methyltransferase [Pseudozyma hubeiensis SY62]GAC96987.1 ubiquinone/menaquinone biosynthesis methyltransferase [Pseudozyma hubeiensis SY62]